MIVAIPSSEDIGLESPVADHFGRAPHFTLIDTADDSATSVPNGGSHFGGAMTAPELLHAAGTSLILCYGLGSRAIALCQESDIDICLGTQPTVREMYEAWKRGELRGATGADGCVHGHH